MRRVLIIAAVALAAAACGNPAGPAAQRTFVYTPVPYITVMTGDTSIPYSVDPNADPGKSGFDNNYAADRVAVKVDPDAMDAFENTMAEYGFRTLAIGGAKRGYGFELYSVFVPPGSAMDAAALIGALPGVQRAYVEYVHLNPTEEVVR